MKGGEHVQYLRKLKEGRADNKAIFSAATRRGAAVPGEGYRAGTVHPAIPDLDNLDTPSCMSFRGS